MSPFWRFEMQVYTYSEARQKLAEVLEQAESSGKVVIRRKDGRTFALVPEKSLSSPMDVPSVKADISTQEIVDIIREGRERGRTWRSTWSKHAGAFSASELGSQT
jgi:antitoxin Phd